jgi:membrane protein
LKLGRRLARYRTGPNAGRFSKGWSAKVAAGRVRSGGDAVSVFCLGMVVGLGMAAADVLRRRPKPLEDAAKWPSGGWFEAAKAAVISFGNDRIPAASAAITFFVLLALFPAISAFVSLYGLVADVSDVERQIAALHGLLPEGAISVVSDELTRLTAADHGALSFAFAISLGVSIWSANAGFKALMDGLNVAYETRERRGFIRLNLESLAFTVGAILAAMAAVAADVYAPAALAPLGPAALTAFRWLRAPVGVVGIIVASSLIYRFGPSRPVARWRWITPGGVVAAVGWIVMSALFSWYVSSFGSYDKTYGSLGAIVGFLTWVWLSTMVLMFGAELNDEVEKRALV